MSVRILQLTDLHLFADVEGRLAGVQTWSTFQAVLAHIRREQPEFDYLILTGDLAQDEAHTTYLALREALGDWLDRCRIIPGNHDDRENLRRAFPELFPHTADILTFALQTEDWCAYGLDSHVPGQVSGHVNSDQVAWLRRELASRPETPTALFMHHPPIPINVAWIDDLGLEEPGELVRLIEASPQVKVVCSGHVHQAHAGHIGAAAMFTTPSTCVQFAARAERAFDTQMAGYRTLLLDAGGYHTEVHRLSGGPDRD